MFYRMVLSLSVLLVAMSAHGKADESSKEKKEPKYPTYAVKKQNQWPTAFFSLEDVDTEALTLGIRGADGGWTGSSYSLLTEEGDEYARAHAVWHAPTSLTFGGAAYEISDVSGKRLGGIHGNLFTLHRAWFALTNADGETVAFAYINYAMNHVMVVDAKQPTRRFAALNRVAPDVVGDADTWSLHVFKSNKAPMEVLTTLAFYVTDYQDWTFLSAVQSLVPGPAQVAEKGKAKITEYVVDLGTEKANAAGQGALQAVQGTPAQDTAPAGAAP